jgi:thioester reductase-like protein
MKVPQGLSFEEKRTLLAALLEKRLQRGIDSPAALQRGLGVEGLAESSLKLKAEVALEASISFDAPPAEGESKPLNIFLTGSTGFLGSFLLDELLKQTRANIYCMVRCPDKETGRRRIREAMNKYRLRADPKSPRIIPVPGDLTKPLFGLSGGEFKKLAECVDCIFHNGAMLNLVSTYEKLRPSNVSGTHEVIRLATLGRLKPVHYISTIATYPLEDSSEVKMIREIEYNGNGMLYGGYIQSKWVAEQMMLMARARGLPVTVYRPGMITGHSGTGIANTEDFAHRMIKATVETATLPDDETECGLNMTPVDYVSKALVFLALSGKAINQIYHLVNAEPISLKHFSKWLKDYGYRIRHIPYEAWREAILGLTMQVDKNRLAAFIVPFFQTEVTHQLPQLMAKMSGSQTSLDRIFGSLLIGYGKQTIQVNCENSARGLIGSGIACPPVDEKLLDTYFSYLIRVGYLPKPSL